MKYRRKHRENHEVIRSVSHKRLRANLSILALVYTVLFFVTIYHLLTTRVVWWQALFCIIIGIVVGAISSRMMKIDWSHDEEKVVGRIDIYGAIILVLFILFEIFRSKIIGLFAGSGSVGTLSLLMLTTIMYGRIGATAKKILATARENI